MLKEYESETRTNNKSDEPVVGNSTIHDPLISRGEKPVVRGQEKEPTPSTSENSWLTIPQERGKDQAKTPLSPERVAEELAKARKVSFEVIQ